MGEIDVKPFQNACKLKYSPDEVEVQAITECSAWQEHLKDPDWHPFKVIDAGGEHKVYAFSLLYYTHQLKSVTHLMAFCRKLLMKKMRK